MIFNNKYMRVIKNKLFVILSILLLAFAVLPSAKAASLTSISDTMSRLKVSTASNHTIQFTTPSGVSAGGTVTVTFPAGFTIGSVDYTDIDVADDGADLALAATPSGATWGAAFSGQVLTITSGTGTIAATSVVTIEIGTNATYGVAGDAQITNSTAGTKIITIAGTFGDTGSMAVAIVSNDQIPVTASVDPTLTLTVANTALALGAMNDSAVATTSENNIVIGTNGYNGYAITVKDAGNGSNPGLYSSEVSKLIASSTATLAAGTEGYGANCNKTSGDGTCSFADGTTDNVTGLTLAGGTFASHSSKPSGNATFRIRVKAAISSSTEAGAYTDTLTVIGTANY